MIFGNFKENLAGFRARYSLLSDNVIFWNLVASSGFLLLLLAIIVFKIKPGLANLPVHYNVLIGVDLVKPGWFLYQLPALGIVVLAYNLFLAKKFREFELFAAHILSLTSTAIIFILFLAAVSLTSIK